jgi:hypothetical protein
MKDVLAFLKPSWSVNLVGIALGILLTGFIIGVNGYQSSGLHQNLLGVNWHESFAVEQRASLQTISENLAHNQVIGTAPLFLVWAGLGLMVYLFTMKIVRGFGAAINLREQMGYVHTSKSDIMKEALTSLGIRIGALIVWFVVLKITLSLLLPQMIAFASNANKLDLQALLHALLAVALGYFIVYVHVVCFRFILLRRRAFGDLDS